MTAETPAYQSCSQECNGCPTCNPVTDEQAERIMTDLREYQADVKVLAEVLEHGFTNNPDSTAWEDLATAVLTSSWLSERDAAIRAENDLTREELQNLAPGSTPVCAECNGNGLEVALNGRVTGDCRVCKGTGR